MLSFVWESGVESDIANIEKVALENPESTALVVEQITELRSRILEETDSLIWTVPYSTEIGYIDFSQLVNRIKIQRVLAGIGSTTPVTQFEEFAKTCRQLRCLSFVELSAFYVELRLLDEQLSKYPDEFIDWIVSNRDSLNAQLKNYYFVNLFFAVRHILNFIWLHLGLHDAQRIHENTSRDL